jgi:hypothetical protein
VVPLPVRSLLPLPVVLGLALAALLSMSLSLLSQVLLRLTGCSPDSLLPRQRLPLLESSAPM